MKILIAYAGKSGTTAKCAKLLAEKLPGAVVADLCETTPGPTDYDTVVIGGCIRMGQLHKRAKQYIVQHENILSQKQAAYFICCGFPANKDQLFSSNIPAVLLKKAVTVQCFGGEMQLDRLHGLDKLIAKMVTKSTVDQKNAPPSLQYDRIDEMATIIQKL